MTLTILNVIYVCVAIAMVVLILMQRGAGAQAGSGFGAGASATVFGARGAGNFLSKSTKWLAIAFFGLSLGIGMFVTHRTSTGPGAEDLGVMDDTANSQPAPLAASQEGDLPVAPPAATSETPAAPGDVPTVPAESAPVTPPEAAKKEGSG